MVDTKNITALQYNYLSTIYSYDIQLFIQCLRFKLLKLNIHEGH